MDVTRSEAIGLLVSMDFETAEKWKDARILAKLERLGDLVDEPEQKQPADKANKALLKKILAAIESEDGLFVVADAVEEKPAKKAAKPAKKEKVVEEEDDDEEESDDDEEETDEEEDEEEDEAPKKKAKPAKKAKADKPAKAKKELVEKDAFNCRVGSQAADINAEISEDPATVEEIAKATKLPNTRITGHLRAMIDRGFVEKTDEGYVVAGAKKAKKAKAKK